MIKKKARKKIVRVVKSKGKAKKSGSKKTIRVKQMDMAKVRNDVANIVGAGAKKIATAVVTEAAKGQLAPTKYLFEMAGVFPVPTGEEPSGEDGESFTKMLYDKLNSAEKPATAPEDDGQEEPVEPGAEEKGDSAGVLV